LGVEGLGEIYRVVSLFSGAGGLDEGFALTGRYEVLFANDVKDFMVKTYSANFKLKKTYYLNPKDFPQVVLSDVSKLDFSRLENFDVDLVVGGPPCQDFSVLRSSTTERQGIMVRRGRLYAHFVRALVHLQPKAFVFENVPGLVSANRGLAYKTIIEDFSHLNLRWDEVKKTIDNDQLDKSKIHDYRIIFRDVVDATHFGVPQARKRLLIVGLRRDIAHKQDPLTLSYKFKKYLRKHKLLKKYPLTSMEAFEGEIIPNLQDRYVEVMKEYDGVWQAVGTEKALKWKRAVWDRLTFNIVEDYLLLNNVTNYSEHELEEAFELHKTILKELDYYGKKVSQLNLLDGSNNPPREKQEIVKRVKMIPPGENYEFVVGSPWELRKKGVSQIYRKLHPLKPSYTVVAYGGGGMAMYHYERSRSALTNREKARLQTFPDAFQFVGSYSTMKAEIGEAVPPLLAKRVAEALARILDEID